MFTSTPGYDQAAVPLPYIMEGRAGEEARNVKVYDLDARRLIDGDLTERAKAFMRRQAAAGRPFFAYVPLTQLHYPTLPHPEFAGRSGAGDFADSMIEMDHRAGELVDEVDALGIAGQTVFLFASDNGPEFRRPWRGTAGPWTGTYHTAMEGGLRAPFIVRWSGRVPAGGVSNEIVHVTDLYPTLARLAGAAIPPDRPIDGVDQLDFFLGRQAKSSRDGFVYYIKSELRAAKWRDWKMHVVWETEPNAGPKHLETPWLFNLTRDPKEETDVGTAMNWARRPLVLLMRNFHESLKAHPPIPPGAPDDYVPVSVTRK
jgi:arylsulfatase